jgi:hypothetical protein
VRRAARTSRLVSSLAILGLIVASLFIVLTIDSSSLANPVLQFPPGFPIGGRGPMGTLGVRLLSNQNQSERFANPSPPSRGWPFPVAHKVVIVTQAGHSSAGLFSEVLETDSGGFTSTLLSPGRYLVSLRDETLDISIPVEIQNANQTTVFVNMSAAAYPLVYSEESGVLSTAGGGQSNVYAELSTSAPVADVSEPVILEVHGTAPGSGYLVNATVLSRQPPTQGAEWLGLGAAGTIDPVNATSLVLTTWTYLAVTKMQGPPSLVF